MKYFFTGLYLLIISSYPLYASEVIENINLKQRTDDIKAQVIALNRDLFLLEEDLLHPISTRVALYLSMDFGRLFTLESVKLKLDGKPVTSFLYTSKDIEALKRGAIQPLYQSNIATGPHELVAFFSGVGTHSRAYKRAVSIKFEKQEGEKSFEIQIIDEAATQQPEFRIKAWN